MVSATDKAGEGGARGGEGRGGAASGGGASGGVGAWVIKERLGFKEQARPRCRFRRPSPSATPSASPSDRSGAAAPVRVRQKSSLLTTFCSFSAVSEME